MDKSSGKCLSVCDFLTVSHASLAKAWLASFFHGSCALHVFNITCGACKAWQTLVTCHVYLGLLVTIVDHSYLYTVRSVARTGNFFERAYM